MQELLTKYGWVINGRNKYRHINSVKFYTYYGFHTEPPYVCPITGEYTVDGVHNVRKLAVALRKYSSAPLYKRFWWTLIDKKFPLAEQ